ncbi:MAG TPA: TlpA disulfide reductase family protein [Puia sp.]|nr:TlpA disulfide reductase family protein [Puia sp.]
MKHGLLTAALLVAINLPAQETTSSSGKASALIRGQVKNNRDTSLGYRIYGYLRDPQESIAIDRKGRFSKEIPIRPGGQEMTLAVGYNLFIFIQPGDTIDLSWDGKDAGPSLSVSSPKAERDTELKTQLFLYQQFQPRYRDIIVSYSRKLPDSVNFNKIDHLYNDEITALLTRPRTTHTNKFIEDVYYQYATFLADHFLLTGHDLSLEHPYEGTDLPFLARQDQWHALRPYQAESEETFRTSHWYREFLLEYIKFGFTPFMTWDSKDAIHYLQNDYYNGMRSFRSREIRDWFVTRLIMDAPDFFSFDEIDTVYRDFITKVTFRPYADTLRQFYAGLQKLRSGNPAPAFVLQNEKGGNVSLADLRGHVVYIDFWGNDCAPCIDDIKNHVPALHERYKDKNIVFVNICVDSDEKTWKEGLEKLHLEGVNLVAEGWTNNKVCNDYQVRGIPHYILIDAAGRIVDSNAPRPWQNELFPLLDTLVEKQPAYQ